MKNIYFLPVILVVIQLLFLLEKLKIKRFRDVDRMSEKEIKDFVRETGIGRLYFFWRNMGAGLGVIALVLYGILFFGGR
ncbi:hypothetical protein [Cupriavidus malaysiensis]|uniref:Molybdenum ABC transporter permease n=1 Tax=Cupriavidus malaysiensis TaxID=367825 RepID=A0ABM6F216_9BURK|nr:hypothetical protein [Cupriavidus malaysiensis]AOZ05184.1 hypothetical protein BKK80_04590 [Cupriavidus malaysiensis]